MSPAQSALCSVTSSRSCLKKAMSNTGVKFRPINWGNDSEVGFVYKSWLGSYKNHASDIPYAMYRQIYQALLDRIMRRPGSEVILAIHPEHDDQIFGFAVIERNSPTLHYIYVKESYRRKGVGSDILEFICDGNTSGEFEFTHSTRMGRNFLKTRGGRFNPRFVRNELP